MASNAPSASQPTEPMAKSSQISKASQWAGRILSGLLVLFLLFDGVTKIMKETYVLKASADLGFTESAILVIGMILLVCTITYVIPRTALLGALLLTGYLGGAVAVQLRVQHPFFTQTLFPVYFGALVWVGLYLRDA